MYIAPHHHHETSRKARAAREVSTFRKGKPMSATPSRRTSRKLLAAAVGACGLIASRADAELIVDLRAIGVTTTAPGVVDPKNVIVSAAADTVTVGVFARVSGTNGINDETLNSVYGLLQSVGTMKGNFAGGFAGAFTDSGASNGAVVDWDSDGDLDIGASPTNSSATGKFFARNGTAGGYTGLAPVTANSAETLVGQFVFTVTAGVGPTDSVDLSFLRRNSNGNNVISAALWFEDGSTVSRNPTNSPYGVGTPVHIVTVPEPATLGLMTLGALSLLRRRRNDCR